MLLGNCVADGQLVEQSGLGCNGSGIGVGQLRQRVGLGKDSVLHEENETLCVVGVLIKSCMAGAAVVEQNALYGVPLPCAAERCRRLIRSRAQ
jgi:hypothetical protein